jgi:hypothetical protein
MWWIILGVLVVAAVVFFIVNYNDYCAEWPYACGAISAVLAVLVLVVCVVLCTSAPIEIEQFEKTKAYVENHISSYPLEDAAITSKKIELNQWLFEAQTRKSAFGAWSFYPESVLDMEPIE